MQRMRCEQRRATKLEQGIAHCKYDYRLQYLGLVRLERQRARSDLIDTFTIMKGQYDVHLWFELDEGGRRGHDQKLFKRQLRLDSRKYVFSNRVVDNWNSLSTHCINSTLCRKKSPTFKLSLTLSNLNRFSKFLHCCLRFLPYLLNICRKFECLISQGSVATCLR